MERMTKACWLPRGRFGWTCGRLEHCRGQEEGPQGAGHRRACLDCLRHRLRLTRMAPGAHRTVGVQLRMEPREAQAKGVGYGLRVSGQERVKFRPGKQATSQDAQKSGQKWTAKEVIVQPRLEPSGLALTSLAEVGQ